MSPTISVVITTYNYGRFIASAIESVLQQTHRPDEILVIDDGSTDDTAAIVARYAEDPSNRVRYIYKENGGANSARNLGIRESKGDLIALLDADDRWLPDKLALQVAHLHRHPAAALVTGSEWLASEEELGMLDDESDPTPKIQNPKSKIEKGWLERRKAVGAADLYRQLLVENIVGSPSLTLIRRKCFDKVGLFDETLALGQDWDMWLRIARRFPMGVVEAPLIYFVQHGDSMSAGKVWQRYRSNRAFHRRFIRPVEPSLTRISILRAAQSMNCFYAAAELANDPSHRGQALGLALVAAILDPVYKAKLKLALLFRMIFGDNAFRWLSRVVK